MAGGREEKGKVVSQRQKEIPHFVQDDNVEARGKGKGTWRNFKVIHRGRLGREGIQLGKMRHMGEPMETVVVTAGASWPDLWSRRRTVMELES